MERGDLPAIVDLEEKQTGLARPHYWEKRIELSEAIRPHWASLVVEIDNRVVGFLLGRAGELEFGLPGTVAWIEMIGVDPAYRRRGVAQALVEKFAESAEDHGIRTIFTLITSNQTEMQHFFSRLGFVHGKMLHYQKEITS
jgi:ribosomal protein S18 acetylase RimI-like enzyme